MNDMLETLQHPIVHRVGWSLVHLLWQGSVLACVLWVVLWLMRRRSPNARYLCSACALATLPVMLAVTFALTPAKHASAESQADEAPPVALIDRQTPAPVTAVEGADAKGSRHSPPAVATPTIPLADDVRADQPASPAPSSDIDTARGASPTIATQDPAHTVATTWQDQAFATQAMPWVVAVWFVGVFVLSCRHVGGLIASRRLRVRGVSAVASPIANSLDDLRCRLGVGRSVSALSSPHVHGPSLVGTLKPAILLPGCVLTGMTTTQLEAVLAHELAHVRRHDYLVNLLQAVVETLLFFHPATWWISRQMRIEREHCCDDLAVSVTGDRVAYARALARLGELLDDQPTRSDALVVAASGASLLDRVSRVVGLKRRRPTRAYLASAGATGLVGLTALASVALLLLSGALAPTPSAHADDVTPATETNRVPLAESNSPSQPAAADSQDSSTPASSPDVPAVPLVVPPIDLGLQNVRLETHPIDNTPAELLPVGLYSVNEQLSVKNIYHRRRDGKIPAGSYQVVGRLPGAFYRGDGLRVVAFERQGRAITIDVQYNRNARSHRELPPREAVYFIADLQGPAQRGAKRVQVRLDDDLTGFEQVLACEVPSVNPELDDAINVLARAAIKAKAGPTKLTFHSGQTPTGLDLSPVLELSGQTNDWRQFPTDNRNFRSTVDALVKARKVWVLCAAIEHRNVDAGILAIKGLEKLADPASVPVLLAAAKVNHYGVSGSENATLHMIFRTSLKRALQKITRLELTPKGLRMTLHEQGKPPRVVKSENPGDRAMFAEEVDFAKVEAWIRLHLLDEVAAATPSTPGARILKQVTQPSDRGKLHDAHQKLHGNPRATINDELLHVPPVDEIAKYTDYDAWFNTIKKRGKVTVAADKNQWVMFRSTQVNDNDRMWIDRIERRGDTFTIHMTRAIWRGVYTRNVTFHELFGVNLGKLPAGRYKAVWVITPAAYKDPDARGYPKQLLDEKRFRKGESLKTTLTVDWTVPPAKGAVDKSPDAPKQDKPKDKPSGLFDRGTARPAPVAPARAAAALPPVEDQKTVSIRVVDGDSGRPIPGATFHYDAKASQTRLNLGDKPFDARLVSDAQGEVALPRNAAEFLQFRVTHPDYLRSRFAQPTIVIAGIGMLAKAPWPYGEVDGQKVIRLWKGESLTGRIRFKDGTPVADYMVRISASVTDSDWFHKTGESIWSGEGPNRWQTFAVTDAAGRFAIAVPPRAMRREFQIHSVSQRAAPFLRELKGNEIGDIDIERGVIVRGVMRDAEGKPIRRTLVNLKSEAERSQHPELSVVLNRQTYTDDAGRFELPPAAAGPHILRPLHCLPRRLTLDDRQRVVEVSASPTPHTTLTFDVNDTRSGSPGINNVSLRGLIHPEGGGAPIPYVTTAYVDKAQKELKLYVPTALRDAQLVARNFLNHVVHTTDAQGQARPAGGIDDRIDVPDLNNPPRLKFWLQPGAPLHVKVRHADDSTPDNLVVEGVADGMFGPRKLRPFTPDRGTWTSPGLYPGERVSVTIRYGQDQTVQSQSKPIRPGRANVVTVKLP